MRVERFIMYMWYKSRPVATFLTNLGGELVNRVTGVLIQCKGTWNGPREYRQFAEALYYICVASRQNGLYCEMCHNCLDLPLNERHMGCNSYAGSLLLLTSRYP